MESKELILKHVKVIFAELEDKGYGRNLTIDATEPEIQKQISEWVKANNINGGEAKFKDYTNKDGIRSSNTTSSFLTILTLQVKTKQPIWVTVLL